MRQILVAIIIISISLGLVGCGETFSGLSKDLKRIGRGVKTVFIRETE